MHTCDFMNLLQSIYLCNIILHNKRYPNEANYPKNKTKDFQILLNSSKEWISDIEYAIKALKAKITYFRYRGRVDCIS